MKKLQMSETRTITFEQGCNMYLDNCRQRNLREGTINHYKQSYTQFYKYFNPQMPITEMTQDVYKQFVVHLRETLHNDVKWILIAQNSRLKDYQDCATTLQNWSKSIFNTFDYPYTNGFTEGCNNKIKDLKRNAYGYRNFNRFRKRILHIFNYKKSNTGKAAA